MDDHAERDLADRLLFAFRKRRGRFKMDVLASNHVVAGEER
jgi:hypothetical protein